MNQSTRARRDRRRALLVASCAVAVTLPSAATLAQLRVVNWNISNYGETSPTGGRSADLKTAIYGQFQGRSMAPDVILGEEFLTQAAVNNFVQVLNTATSTPGDWAAGTFVDGNDTDTAFFYRTTKVNFVRNQTVAVGTTDGDDQPRNTQRFDITLKGYAGAAPALSLYGVHLKAGDTGSDNSRRLVETTRIRTDAQTLPAGTHFLIGGDMNVQSSAQSAYQKLVRSESSNAGRFFDPIATPGDWNDDIAFRFVHTQDPTGQMDDRHDQILLGGSLVDGKGFDYVGNTAVPYSTSTWNDPNHSYRAWGNDGSTFNGELRMTNNGMVGASVAQSLKDVATDSGGHLPVFLDLRVPGELAVSTASIDFGTVTPGGPSSEQRSFQVANGVDLGVWLAAAAVDDLRYTLLATGGDFAAEAGSFTDPAGGGALTNFVTLTDTTVGEKSGQLQILVDGVLARTIPLSVTVVPEPAATALAASFAGIAVLRRRRTTKSQPRSGDRM